MYISRFFNPIQTLAEQFDMLEQSFAAAEKINLELPANYAEDAYQTFDEIVVE